MKPIPNQALLPFSGKIFFNDIDLKSTFKNRNLIRSWIKEVIRKEKHQLDMLSFNFCSDEKLLEINRTYLNHDYYTDIITFPLAEGKIVSGDIYISLERVKENASANQKTYTNELMRVMIHGVLHLCGYKDKSRSESSLMRKKEDYYLSLLDTFHVSRGTRD